MYVFLRKTHTNVTQIFLIKFDMNEYLQDVQVFLLVLRVLSHL